MSSVCYCVHATHDVLILQGTALCSGCKIELLCDRPMNEFTCWWWWVLCVQEEGRQLLHRAETAEGQVYHLESEKLTLFTRLEDTQQQLPALQTQLEVRAWTEPASFLTSLHPQSWCTWVRQHGLIMRYAGWPVIAWSVPNNTSIAEGCSCAWSCRELLGLSCHAICMCR